MQSVSPPNLFVSSPQPAEPWFEPPSAEGAAPVTEQEKQIQAMVQKYLEQESKKKEQAKKDSEGDKKPETGDASKGDKGPALSEEYLVGSQLDMTAKWNNGLELATKNKDFKIHLGGRYQFDSAMFSAAQQVQRNINTPYHDGVDFRRARLRMDGTIYETIDFAAEFDFVNSAVVGNQTPGLVSAGFLETTVTAPTDLWWQLREVPFFGSIRIGNQKEQVGFEHIVSSRFQPFMERSYNQDTFYGGTYNGFSPGIQFLRNYGANDDGCLAGGLFKPLNNAFGYGIGDGDYAVSGRATRLLWHCDDGRSLFHVGCSGRQATAVGNRGLDYRLQTFRTRDAIRAGLSGDWSVPAGINLVGDTMQWLNAEVAGVHGPWTLQGEYLLSNLENAATSPIAPGGNNAFYHGGYVQLLYFLTGENDRYNKQTGVFDRVIPNENFFLVRDRCGGHACGLGAWQLGLRYNYLDLNDNGLNGGILNNVTSGLNWFWNPNMKCQFNYMGTYRDVAATTNFPAGSGWINGFGVRVAMDF